MVFISWDALSSQLMIICLSLIEVEGTRQMLLSRQFNWTTLQLFPKSEDDILQEGSFYLCSLVVLQVAASSIEHGFRSEIGSFLWNGKERSACFALLFPVETRVWSICPCHCRLTLNGRMSGKQLSYSAIASFCHVQCALNRLCRSYRHRRVSILCHMSIVLNANVHASIAKIIPLSLRWRASWREYSELVEVCDVRANTLEAWDVVMIFFWPPQPSNWREAVIARRDFQFSKVEFTRTISWFHFLIAWSLVDRDLWWEDEEKREEKREWNTTRELSTRDL